MDSRSYEIPSYIYSLIIPSPSPAIHGITHGMGLGTAVFATAMPVAPDVVSRHFHANLLRSFSCSYIYTCSNIRLGVAIKQNHLYIKHNPPISSSVALG